MRCLSPKLSKSKYQGRLHGRPIADLGGNFGRCSAASRKRTVATAVSVVLYTNVLHLELSALIHDRRTAVFAIFHLCRT